MFVLLFLILGFHFFLLINTRFTLWPEMVVYPYLLNNGFSLYKDIINPYPPLLTYFLTIFTRIFGYDPLPFQYLTWFTVLIVDLLIFIISRKIFKSTIHAFISIIFFSLISIPFLINGLWFDLVQTPLILLAFYQLYKFVIDKSLDYRNLFLASFFLTIAFFIKQQVLWISSYFLAVIFYKFRQKAFKIFTRNFLIGAPFLLILIVSIVFFWSKNLLGDFLWWVFYFPFFKASQMPGYILLPTFRQAVSTITLFLFFTPLFLKREFRTNLIITCALVTILFAYPRFDYFHLIPSVALLSIASPQVFLFFSRAKIYTKAVFITSLILLSVFTTHYLLKNWVRQVRFFEKDVVKSALLLSKITADNRIIYIQNGPDQLLPLSNKIPPKPWVDEFPWYLQADDIENRVIYSLSRERPQFIIFEPYDDSNNPYETGAYRPAKIADYLDNNYSNFLQISDTLWLKIRK